MAKWNGNIISKDARYRTQTNVQGRGIYSLDEQLQHKAAGNWTPQELNTDAGYWLSDLTIVKTSVTADNADNYSVATVPMPAGASQGRVYLACEITASVTYYNDFCIGWVQIPHDNGTNLNTTVDTATNVDWQMDAYGTNWQRGSAVTSSNNTLSSVSGYSWTNIASGSSNDRWNLGTSTNSSRTGAQGGMSEGTGFNIMAELGDLTVPGNSAARLEQENSSNYIFVEASGMVEGEIVWCRSPEVTLTGSNHVLVIGYHAYTSSDAGDGTVQGMVNTSSKRLLRAFWDES